MAQASASTAVRDAGVPVHVKAGTADQPDDVVTDRKERTSENRTRPSLKGIDRHLQLVNQASREDSKKKKQRATVRPRQAHHPVSRRVPGPNPGYPAKMAVARPLGNSGSARRRPGGQGFSAFLEQCKRLLGTGVLPGLGQEPSGRPGSRLPVVPGRQLPVRTVFSQAPEVVPCWSRQRPGGLSETQGHRRPLSHV
ncbi:hypothetical protein MTO96_021637 [Rhipicephalus appendiculatus]